jgi:feruloyl-CoA synthase
VSAPFRPVELGDWSVTVAHDSNGIIRITPDRPINPYPTRLTDVLDRWAAETPDRIFLAQRTPVGPWRTISYSEFRTLSRNAAQWLLNQNLTPERPVTILSGNDIEHAVLGMAALYAGLPYAPASPAYSLISKDFAKLRHIFDLLTPGLVFANDARQYGPALDAVPPGTPIITTAQFSQLTSTPATEAITRTTARITPDAIAKILFTSGSTGIPKGVINTHRMLCANQEQLATAYAVLRHTAPVICDWLPWHHTFGGNHNFGIALYNGGTLYIDDGKPMGKAFEETIRNLREIAPTVYFNVPKGYETLVAWLRRDPELRLNFFSRLSLTFYAAAGLSQQVWDELDALAVETCGERVIMLTGLGSTETGPYAIATQPHNTRSGVVGLPVPGVELKLVPNSGKLEARVKGPNITPGFWRQPELTRAVIDDEGFYSMGDALRLLDPTDPTRGLLFDGRIAEDFKLSTGTWVSVGPLRAKFLAHAAPYVRDIVFAGHDRDELTALIFPDPNSPPDRAQLEQALRTFAAQSTGTSTRICRAILLTEPPSIDAGEITDKGSINQRAVLTRRADLVEALYTDPPPPIVVVY